MTRILLASLVVGWVGFTCAYGQVVQRNWTSTDGKTLPATMVGMEAAGVKLKLATGAVVTVPLTRLSAADQDYVNATVKQLPASGAATPEAESTWPKSVGVEDKPEITVVKEDAAAKEFIYRSPHYEFVCDSRLGQNVVKEFGRLFEATYLLNCKLPLKLDPKPERLRDIFQARLYTDEDDYRENGGVAGSAGIYMSADKALKVPLKSLGVKMVGSRVSLEGNDEDDNATLIHEITHQMMNHWLGGLRTWLTEGSAEYVEMLEYNRNGRFSLNGLTRRVQAYAERMGYWQKGAFEMLDLEELMNISGGQWSAALTRPVKVNVPGMTITGATQATQNYGSAGMLTYYFYHLDDKGDAAHIIDYFRDMEGKREGPDEDAAMKKHLMRDRSYAQLAEDVKKAFRKEGIDVTFSAPGKNGVRSAEQ